MGIGKNSTLGGLAGIVAAGVGLGIAKEGYDVRLSEQLVGAVLTVGYSQGAIFAAGITARCDLISRKVVSSDGSLGGILVALSNMSLPLLVYYSMYGISKSS